MKTLKLGTETGSLMNAIYSESNNTPEVGKGATQILWTDRVAFFVNSVSDDLKSCTIEKARAIRVDNTGMSDGQNYKYVREENPYVLNLKFRYGSWYIDYGKDASIRYNKINIKFGFMKAYFDYSF